jgi:hypothetical protein
MIISNTPVASVGDHITVMYGGVNHILSQQVTLSTWHHAVMRRTGNVTALFIDNVLVGSDSSFSSLPPSGNFTIGGNLFDLTHTIDGKIDEVAVYNRALTLTEIAGIYNSSLSITNLNQPTSFCQGAQVVVNFSAFNFGVGNVFNMAHHTFVNFRNLNVAFVVSGNYFTAWPVLPLLVRYLMDVLRQLVNGQAGTGVDRLPLHSPASRQYISRPLPLVVRATRHEPQVIQFVAARVAVGIHRHSEA